MSEVVDRPVFVVRVVKDSVYYAVGLDSVPTGVDPFAWEIAPGELFTSPTEAFRYALRMYDLYEANTLWLDKRMSLPRLLVSNMVSTMVSDALTFAHVLAVFYALSLLGSWWQGG